MKTLSTPISTEAAAEQSAWAELYEIYLPSTIATPHGTNNILRLVSMPSIEQHEKSYDYPGTYTFFAPLVAPEPVATRGVSALYFYWPVRRDQVKGSAKVPDDKVVISFSNVTQDWASMLDGMDWYGVQIVVRKVATSIAVPTNQDSVIIFSGHVDSAKITNEAVQLICSSDLGSLAFHLPAEPLHQNCRFNWGDDMCMALRLSPSHYKSKTAGSGCSTTVIKSSGLTEDGGTAPYHAQAVTADASTDKITLTGHGLANGQLVRFGGTAVPGGITAGFWYWVVDAATNDFKVSITEGGTAVDITSAGTAVTIDSTAPYGTDEVDALSSGAITTSSEQASYEGYRVKASDASHWRTSLSSDWGTVVQGYWQIPDAEAGIANPTLKPQINFDFGTAKAMRLWRVASRDDVNRDLLIRMILIFSSSDNIAWRLETYFEMPPRAGALFDVLIPDAQSARYWRICIRSRWNETFYYSAFEEIRGHVLGRNFWAHGWVTFTSGTLNGVRRQVLESYSGELIVAELPSAPANGDTFIIERGCPRTWNGCCERRNWENFGGFLELVTEQLPR